MGKGNNVHTSGSLSRLPVYLCVFWKSEVVQPGNAQRSVAADGGRGGLLKIMARVALLQMVVDQCLRSAKIVEQSTSSQSNFRLLG